MTDFVSASRFHLLPRDRGNHPTVNKNTRSSASQLPIFIFADRADVPIERLGASWFHLRITQGADIQRLFFQAVLQYPRVENLVS